MSDTTTEETQEEAARRRDMDMWAGRAVHFVLKAHWYAEMLKGRKDIEYRALGQYWASRLMGHLIGKPKVTRAVFSLGYSKRRRFVRPVRMIDIGPCPYPGWDGDYYRVHLGPVVELPLVWRGKKEKKGRDVTC